MREEILRVLSKGPSTLTEIAMELGISKSTASYHLALLSEHGVVEPVATRVGRGGVSVVRYGLRSGSLVLFGGGSKEEEELRRLRETFDVETLGWNSSKSETNLVEVQTLLYKLFLRMFRTTRSEHRSIMLEYGERVGSLMSRRVQATSSRQALLGIASFLRESGIAEVDLVEIPSSTVSVLVSSVCIGSDLHVGNSCYFLEGIITGMVREKLGASAVVGRIDVPGLSGCCFATGRVKSLDSNWLAEALLSSPRYSSIGRARGGP
ncbi:MAG TPA: winged helix-turn-helix domain-containing protein [Nitrososphaerales archaeon]|nr:winged helix-turn-helix domain-containing protein [Nitrososphaerales archaeon]